MEPDHGQINGYVDHHATLLALPFVVSSHNRRTSASSGLVKFWHLRMVTPPFKRSSIATPWVLIECAEIEEVR